MILEPGYAFERAGELLFLFYFYPPQRTMTFTFPSASQFIALCSAPVPSCVWPLKAV